MLLDDKKVHPSYDIGVWVNTQLFAGTLNTLFEHLWEQSVAVEAAPVAK